MNVPSPLAFTETMTMPRTVTIFGATGTIGVHTLDLIGRAPDSFYDVVALTAHQNVELLAKQAIAHRAEIAVIGDESKYHALKDALAGSGVQAAAGEQALTDAAQQRVDWYMAAIVGAAGLRPTLEAVRQGTHVALANKECLVTAGELFMGEVAAANTVLLPVDSEHSAAYQSLDGKPTDGIERIVLTASGGPFREWSRERMSAVTPEQALAHPNWSMGPKITIDSATMMNKGLEIIEAYHLFPVEASQLDILVHPQSIIHCLVEYCDGSVLAQMSCPDMRAPISYSLAWPKRMPAPTARLDLAQLGKLTFEPPDDTRFPALRVAREVLESTGGHSTVLNAANEIAVHAFLDRKIGFLSIIKIVESTLELAQSHTNLKDLTTLDEILDLDGEARRLAQSLLPKFAI
ncbi:1-deoxy-D-xylulose 5-phosphate reductoisomerase [bacterium MnTg02]|nr:1-deoxy-D-xylulose 5-phosphate reductoisomerase [bacterium MnTg02]